MSCADDKKKLEELGAIVAENWPKLKEAEEQGPGKKKAALQTVWLSIYEECLEKGIAGAERYANAAKFRKHFNDSAMSAKNRKALPEKRGEDFEKSASEFDKIVIGLGAAGEESSVELESSSSPKRKRPADPAVVDDEAGPSSKCKRPNETIQLDDALSSKISKFCESASSYFDSQKLLAKKQAEVLDSQKTFMEKTLVLLDAMTGYFKSKTPSQASPYPDIGNFYDPPTYRQPETDVGELGPFLDETD